MKKNKIGKGWMSSLMALLVLAALTSCKKQYPSEPLKKVIERTASIETLNREIIRINKSDSTQKKRPIHLFKSAYQIVDSTNLKECILTVDYNSTIDSTTYTWASIKHQLYLCQIKYEGKKYWIPFKSNVVGSIDDQKIFFEIKTTSFWEFLSLGELEILYFFEEELAQYSVTQLYGNEQQRRKNGARISQSETIFIDSKNEIFEISISEKAVPETIAESELGQGILKKIFGTDQEIVREVRFTTR